MKQVVSISVVLSAVLVAGFGGKSSLDMVKGLPIQGQAGLSEAQMATVHLAGAAILDSCPGLKDQIDRFGHKVLYLSELGQDGWTDNTLKQMGWVASVTLEWEAGEYVSLGQGDGPGKPSGLYAYGTFAQTACGLPTAPKGQLSAPMAVSIKPQG